MSSDARLPRAALGPEWCGVATDLAVALAGRLVQIPGGSAIVNDLAATRRKRRGQAHANQQGDR